MLDRVMLGTVQLGQPYGRRALEPLISEARAFEILDAAWDAGIRGFDTAEIYGNAASRLCRWIDERNHWKTVHVVTKVRVDPEGSLTERVTGAVAQFAAAASVTLLAHNALARDEWAVFSAAAENCECALGQSVYTAGEAKAAASLPGVARIQVPGNVFDTRCIDERDAAEVPLDVRSAFLQGVLLDAPELAERRAPGAGRFAEAVRAAASEMREDCAALLIGYVLARTLPSDRVVVGVDNVSDLDAICRAASIPAETAIEFGRLARSHAGGYGYDALDPRRWPRPGASS